MEQFEYENESRIYKPERLQDIEPKPCIKDPGILIDCDIKYNSQLQRAVSKTNAKVAQILRTSERRDTNFLRQLWKLLLQCHMDYGSVLWSPVGRKDVKFQEGPLRTFTKRGKGIYELNYCQLTGGRKDIKFYTFESQ